VQGILGCEGGQMRNEQMLWMRILCFGGETARIVDSTPHGEKKDVCPENFGQNRNT
jgi:hypothetical protein